ncbi:MAG: Enoyl-CoA hydratase [uncultured Nocardioidaceae bacterium]|uniref:Enoyl-CoA hydratase n=1 Tax=uncultured Nocardioidaceae bacterium TaxID=253824 RepID=A0A6J4LAW7_9ACTN|nr:MAG: Enoyl-CoA hydratase [uncultured Nocardioidaceae bacterium]
MSDALVTVDGPVLTVTFDRPHRHNALTFEMYDALHDACGRADSDEQVRALVVRGSGGRAFASGTDISAFGGFQDGSDGVAYEERITRVVNRLEEVTVPTLAAVQGFCLGGGLVLAAACDVRIATGSARFGAPIARTLGNCLSANSVSLLSSRLGSGRVLDLLLRARLLTAEEGLGAGFLAQVCDEDGLDQAVEHELSTLLSHAPLTMWATKVVVARQRRAGLVDADDVVARAFGSEDFRSAVAGFGSRDTPSWQGR